MATVLILGSTGLTGSLLLEKLLTDNYFTEITAVGRKPLDISNDRLKVIVTDFTDIAKLGLKADIVFSCLGTTKSKTPNPEQYRFIEVGIPIEVAKCTGGIQQFHYISSIGTSEGSKAAYLQNKWEAEAGLRNQNISSLYLYRPSLIFGERKETRILEGISGVLMGVFSVFLVSKLKKYRKIKAATIAQAMVNVSKSPSFGTHVLESDEIEALGSN